MILIPNDTLSLSLERSVEASDIYWYVSFVDKPQTENIPYEFNGITSGREPVEIVGSPAKNNSVNTQRVIKYLTIFNQNAVSRAVTLYLNNLIGSRIIRTTILQAGDVLEYTEGFGFKVMNHSGELKQTGAVGASAAVRNSDSSYMDTVAAGGTLVLPDEVLRVYASGVLNYTGSYIPLSSNVINAIF